MSELIKKDEFFYTKILKSEVQIFRNLLNKFISNKLLILKKL